jgi:hypothetical protein
MKMQQKRTTFAFFFVMTLVLHITPSAIPITNRFTETGFSIQCKTRLKLGTRVNEELLTDNHEPMAGKRASATAGGSKPGRGRRSKRHGPTTGKQP